METARTKARPQSQKVSQDQVGTVEEELPGIAESPVTPDSLETQFDETGQEFNARPPIILETNPTKMKILATGQKYPLLNNFTLFLAVSDKLVKNEGEFFNHPHTTRVIWASHRVTYIFTEGTGRLNLYYDLELKDPIQQAKTGGNMFPTTTLITKHRVFIPIPYILEDEFQLASGPKEFFVRFDILSSDLL